ncbi:hypothetical protein HanRHA438_Chr04g0166051 [Helianthus annuus]|uniref:Uncharacterized protein n=1 Tax=Helianthus annuus TaxID=4232 RepID=A0A9K3NQY1_HELAN|nr:hypothetical protein HanXRQr2_Chr04g0155881 [Helianthus annuus]KAJ0596289.1 hypothetical protein HanHA89_Chr04g0141081 [Helianthus annuus]KAJ0926001.1 hypothetical protein HanRHA438_Chr04g0166051 [Helianthus annuus]KAJ0930488.1 hypothetical protein HanPSC8_Chr04g0149891 [Helianthus annuus]
MFFLYFLLLFTYNLPFMFARFGLITIAGLPGCCWALLDCWASGLLLGCG